MKLSKTDRENIEVLEALDIDENALFLLLCRYFAHRKLRLTPEQALQETIYHSMFRLRPTNTPTPRPAT